MGKALSVITKPFREFNLEARAHKVISKDKPTPAPWHKADLSDYERIKKEYPEAYDQALKKHKDLDKNLRSVFVVSKDPDPITQNPNRPQQNPEKPLPINRQQVQDFEFGFKEPDKVPIGKISLRNALKFINDHQADPKTYTAAKIAEDYILAEDKVRNILKYFKVFQLYIPQQREVKATFAGPAIAKPKISKQMRKQLPEPEKKDDT